MAEATQDPTPTTDQPMQSQPAAQEDRTPAPVPYARFKEVNDQLGEMKTRLAQIEQATKDREQRELVEQGKWKELAEQRERELATERQQSLRLKIASAKGLPIELADRLKGDDEATLTADADSLIALMKTSEDTRGIPPTPRGGGKDTALDITKMTPAQIRENRKKLFPGRG